MSYTKRGSNYPTKQISKHKNSDIMNYPEAIRSLAICVGYQRGINKESFNVHRIEEITLQIAANYNHDQLIELCVDKHALYSAVHIYFDTL